MNNAIQQLIEKYKSCPTSQSEYEIDGKVFTVTRHFTGDKNINRVIYSLAERHADKDAGIT